jgi:hypothetical protein
MPGNPREMITSAERRFPVRIRIAVPPNGLGQHTRKSPPGSMRTAGRTAGL